MRTRMLQGSAPKKANWDNLLQKAIEKAELVGDRRLNLLKTAQAQGQSVQVLKKLGIIGENDLTREFPPKKT